MSQQQSVNNVIEVPMTTLTPPSYPENTMSTAATNEQPTTETEQDQRSMLRLRGGGCITDCLAAIGCCCVCEECCC